MLKYYLVKVVPWVYDPSLSTRYIMHVCVCVYIHVFHLLYIGYSRGDVTVLCSLGT